MRLMHLKIISYFHRDLIKVILSGGGYLFAKKNSEKSQPIEYTLVSRIKWVDPNFKQLPPLLWGHSIL